MSVLRSKIEIDAPLELVFDTVSNINNFSKAIPHIVDSEIISEIKSGVGTRFREKRLIKGKEAVEEMEVTEYQKNSMIRIICDSHGTVWDSVFRVESVEDNTVLTLEMEARSYAFFAKIMNRFIGKMIKNALDQDMKSVKEYCETESK